MPGDEKGPLAWGNQSATLGHCRPEEPQVGVYGRQAQHHKGADSARAAGRAAGPECGSSATSLLRPKGATCSRSLSEIDFGSPQIKSQDFGEEGGVDY
jgi:hypothetical protein